MKELESKNELLRLENKCMLDKIQSVNQKYDALSRTMSTVTAEQLPTESEENAMPSFMKIIAQEEKLILADRE